MRKPEETMNLPASTSTILQLDSGVPEPIAIIGMSCRLSGTATSPNGLWQMLSKGLTGWSTDGGNRFRLESFWHPQADLGGSVGDLTVC